MKKVLIVANAFPPIGGAGVQRSVKFVKHLRKFGYEPVVLTRTADKIEVFDETLMKDIPDGVKVIRTKAYDPRGLSGILKLPGKAVGKLMIPDSDRMWAEKSKRAAVEIIKKEKIEYIYTTSAPYSAHLLGLYVKTNLSNIKWVADFRDEWTNNPYILDNPHNKIRSAIEKDMESKVLNTADALITNTPVMRENFVKTHNLKGENFFVIPNGYDEEDFAGYEKVPVHNERFTMVYTGALYGRRKPDTFFAALQQLIEENKIDGKKVVVKLFGNYHKDKLQTQIDSYNLTGKVEIVGYVSHDVCIKEQMQSDVLVLIEGTGRGAEAFYTGKIFEYMNTGKPVLALLPENGVAADLVRESNIGIVAHTDNVEQIKRNLLQYYSEWENGTLKFVPNQSVIERYERKKLTEKLAEVFDGLEKQENKR